VNYTNPNDLNHVDTPEDWLNCSLIFANALGFLLSEDEGVVIDNKGDMNFNLLFKTDNIKKIILYNSGEQIKIIECDGDIEDGTIIWMARSEEHANFFNTLKNKEMSISIDNALDYLFHYIENKLITKNFDFCEKLFKAIKLNEYSVDILIGLLTITLPWKVKLISRNEYFMALTSYLLTIYEPDTVENLLRGLK